MYTGEKKSPANEGKGDFGFAAEQSVVSMTRLMFVVVKFVGVFVIIWVFVFVRMVHNDEELFRHLSCKRD